MAQSGERCSCGGGCPRCSAGAPVQAKLAVSQPGDRHERQADRVADAIVSPGRSASDARAPAIDPVRPEDAASASLPVPVDRLGGEGRALPDAERRLFESRLGRDLGDVRIHTDAGAASAAQALQARAFTRGRDIYFGAGEFRPDESAGAHLLAHELVHTVQQAHGDAAQMPIMRAPPDEDADKKRIRLAAARDAANAIDNLRLGLISGQLWNHEVANEPREGYVLIETSPGRFEAETVEDRARRLKEFMADMIAFSRVLEAGAVPAHWYKYDIDFPKRGKDPGMLFGVSNQMIQFYAHWAADRKQNSREFVRNEGYMETKPISGKRIAAAALARPHKVLDLWINVPDPENKPLSYTTLSGFAKSDRGIVVDVSQDAFGYFYEYEGSKHYLPRLPQPGDVAQ